jgi:hypothetical protein
LVEHHNDFAKNVREFGLAVLDSKQVKTPEKEALTRTPA